MLFFNRVVGNCMLFLLYAHSMQAGLTFFDQTSTIKLEPQATFINQSSHFAGISGTLSFGSQASVQGNPIVFNNGNITNGTFTISLTGTFDPSMTSSIQLVSPSIMNVTIPGKIPFKVQASGTNNTLEGLPIFQNPNSISFKNSSSALTISILNSLNTSPTLASTINLGADLELGDHVVFNGSGTINFNDFNLITGKKSLVWTSTLTLINASNLVLSANSIITAPWTFQGVSNIEGNGYTLELGPNGALILAPGASLIFNNVTIQGIAGTNISCMDCAGTVSFGNVVWKQSADFTFGNGGFDVLGMFELVGTSSFIFSPCRTCNIESLATMQLDHGMTFLYKPSSNNRNLLAFQDDSSVLTLENATLASTSTGIILTNGSLIVDGHCYLTQNTSAPLALSASIQVGNGNPADEMTITIGPSAILDCLSGHLVYDQGA